MGWTLVQQKTAEAGNFDSTTIDYNSDVTSGNLLTCSGGVWNGTEITSVNVTSTKSPAFDGHVGTGSAGTPGCPFLAHAVANASGPCTVTIDPNGGSRYASYTISEWSLDAGGPAILDTDGGGKTGGAELPSDTIDVVADALVIGVVTHGAGGGTMTPGSGYSQLGEVESGANCPSNTEYQVFASAGTKTVDWSANPPNWSMYCVSFKATGGGAATPDLKLIRTYP